MQNNCDYDIVIVILNLKLFWYKLALTRRSPQVFFSFRIFRIQCWNFMKNGTCFLKLNHRFSNIIWYIFYTNHTPITWILQLIDKSNQVKCVWFQSYRGTQKRRLAWNAIASPKPSFLHKRRFLIDKITIYLLYFLYKLKNSNVPT